MDSFDGSIKKRSREHDADDEDIEYEESKQPTQSRVTGSEPPTQIISSNQVDNYLDRGIQMNMETFNEQIGQIQKAIIQESNCPDVIPFDTNLYLNLCEIIKNQQEGLDELEQSYEKKMYHNIYELEIERIKYLLKSYLRARLAKIQKHATYILRNNLQKNLSDSEIVFLKQFFELKEKHFTENALSHLPKQFRNLGKDPSLEKVEKTNNEFMVVEPSLDQMVTVKVLRTYEKFALDVENGKEINFIPGDVYCIRYKDIKNLVENGYLELI